MNSTDKKISKFLRLLDIMDELRVKCPWDRKQTMLTLRNQTIEECFELTDAIVRADVSDIKKELGDLLLHIVFYSKIADEQGDFDIADVIDSLCQKLIYRHPHVFAESTTNIDTSKDVEQQWAELKQTEKDGNTTIMSGVPRGMPALPKACRIQQKAAATGFDWKKREDVWEKVREELDEVLFEVHSLSEDHTATARIEAEFGDLLFSVVNAARLYGVDPELALERTNRKFLDRFGHIEKCAREKNIPLQNLSLDQMEEYWQEAKRLNLEKL